MTGHWYSFLFADHGPFYGPVSGWVGDLALLSVPLTMIRHRNCHVKGCWRFGKHPHGPYLLCAKHHPDVPDEPVTTEHVEQVET